MHSESGLEKRKNKAMMSDEQISVMPQGNSTETKMYNPARQTGSFYQVQEMKAGGKNVPFKQAGTNESEIHLLLKHLK